jgi:hypothetical protein
VTGPRPSSYPEELAGGLAYPPVPPTPDEVAAARAAARESARRLEEPPRLFGSGTWRSAGSLEVLLAEANAVNPGRDRASDGGIGDAAHAKLGRGSDHNAWVVVAGLGVYRARDFDVDGLDVAGAFERMRAAAVAGALPQLVAGGYLIHNRRITAPDFSGWRFYTGPNPHTLHGHVSVSTDPARFDDRRPWGVWLPHATPPSPTVPPPSPPAPTGWVGPDLTGAGLSLRGDQGNNGRRVAALQQFWRTRYSLYAKGLAVDGWWGPATTAACYQFARRSGIRSADGRNIGPQVARQLYLAGFRG